MASFLNKEANLTYFTKVNSSQLISHCKLFPLNMNIHFSILLNTPLAECLDLSSFDNRYDKDEDIS